MTSASKRRWQLIRESIKFQIKLILDAARDLILSPVAIICTVLDLVKGNSKQDGHFQRLMHWGHNTDHWLNLFGDLPVNAKEASSVDAANNTDKNPNTTQGNYSKSTTENPNLVKNQLDENFDKLFGKIERLLEEQQQAGGLTAVAKQKIELYLTSLNSNRKGKVSQTQVTAEEELSPNSELSTLEVDTQDKNTKTNNLN
ncbi:hypothetical protein FGD67_13470 [Colwellia sp. M166]|uniref:hypothetical protein n=1 Tax=Colwellia sp. M166 TaxID=2583805 RepID=UPI00211EDC2A|nr:hypothetical protein [Colwellia sp. M166]UUO24125.1 hypothetical protein FGD67_13470 [Colwellia sp. M166]|tara:strand:+ start:4939 stop:5538 length:600 start_codon:yes stop_codon:yes gene_type:complete